MYECMNVSVNQFLLSIHNSNGYPTCEVHKGPDANAASENSRFIFTVCVISVPLYHFKLAYVVLYMSL